MNMVYTGWNLKSSFWLSNIYVLYQVYTLHNLLLGVLQHTYPMYSLVLVFQFQYIHRMSMRYGHIVDILTYVRMSLGYLRLCLGCVRGSYSRESLIQARVSDSLE